MKILYLANPNSVHDLKWISFFSQQEGYECYIVPYGKGGGDLAKYTAKANKLGIKVLPGINNFLITHIWQWLPDLLRLRRLIRREQIDMIHIMYADPAGQWAAFKRWLRVPMVLTTRGSDILIGIPETLKRETLMRKLIAPVYERAFPKFDHISSTSTLQEAAARELSQEKVPTAVIRTGVNIEAFDKPTADHFPASLPDKPYVIFPRMMRPVYNQEFSLAGIAELPEEVKKRFAFVFLDAGSSHTGYVQKIKDLMAEQPEVDFQFLNAVSQPVLFELLKRASLIVMNPTSDGSPVTAMEAMLATKPLILGPLNYDKDLFGKGVIILKDWDATELAAEMEAILTEKKSLDVQAARKVIEEKGNRAIEMTKLGEVYQKVWRG
jgi:hypothetical protein